MSSEATPFLVIVPIALLFLLCCYFLVRNKFVHDVRIAFINDHALFPRAYYLLPDYDQMLHGAKFQLLWTKAHWMAWVERQS